MYIMLSKKTYKSTIFFDIADFSVFFLSNPLFFCIKWSHVQNGTNFWASAVSRQVPFRRLWCLVRWKTFAHGSKLVNFVEVLFVWIYVGIKKEETWSGVYLRIHVFDIVATILSKDGVGCCEYVTCRFRFGLLKKIHLKSTAPKRTEPTLNLQREFHGVTILNWISLPWAEALSTWALGSLLKKVLLYVLSHLLAKIAVAFILFCFKPATRYGELIDINRIKSHPLDTHMSYFIIISVRPG